MDPFTRIPAELRLQIFSSLQSKATISSLIQASPIMLKQYLGYKSTVTRNLLERDFDDQMIQDAMGIILFPSLREARKSTFLVHEHLKSWESREFPNPLTTRDAFLVDQLDKLHSLLMVFVEDYITKATAAFPPREYICLPQLSHNQRYLVFKGQKVTKRSDSCHLTDAERRRFLRAFLHVELLSLIHKALSFTTGDRMLVAKLSRRFRRRHMEAFHCIWVYASSLYGAIFAHCSDAWLPAVDAPPETRLLFPDNFFADPVEYGKDVGIRSKEDLLAVENMACYGFSLIFTMICFAITRPQDTKALESYAKKLCSFKMDPTLHIGCRFKRRFSREREYGPLYRHSSSYRQHLAGRIWWKSIGSPLPLYFGVVIKIFQQRAWPFFDDDHHYPEDTDVLPVFPNVYALHYMELEREDEVSSLSGSGPVTRGRVERTMSEFRRSQKWQDKMKQRQGNNSSTESSLPRISIGNRGVALPPIEDQDQLLTWSFRGVVQWDASLEAYVLVKK
ncbi:hypothetical protein FAGAP_8540 [Fusarium agapanthi]|uniref:Uncharacterized protein n=1 Tax=Fusarium agapanthi TaxID=1803897 RepID=A0A9P5E523_9HYPO|nr:hypothetical protein FAGAP_8540 [Fusarium agapanthi]